MKRDSRRPQTKAANVAAPVREPLTAERIYRTALSLCDREGLEAVSMRRLGQELGRFSHACYACELSQHLCPPHAPEPTIYRLLLELLDYLDRLPLNDRPAVEPLRSFELRLLDAVGLGISLNQCATCGTDVPRALYVPFDVAEFGDFWLELVESEAIADLGFALAGGSALLDYDIVTRDTDDIDAFLNSTSTAAFTSAVEAVIAACDRSGSVERSGWGAGRSVVEARGWEGEEWECGCGSG